MGINKGLLRKKGAISVSFSVVCLINSGGWDLGIRGGNTPKDLHGKKHKQIKGQEFWPCNKKRRRLLVVC